MSFGNKKKTKNNNVNLLSADWTSNRAKLAEFELLCFRSTIHISTVGCTPAGGVP